MDQATAPGDRVIDLDEVRRARLPDDAPGDPTAVLHRVALLLNSTLELRELLRRLGRLTLQVSEAERCSLFLVERRRLVPVVALGRVDDEDLFDAFREMDPVDRDRVASGWVRLEAGGAIPIADPATSELVPPGWVERFGLESLVLVPLQSAGELCGLLVVDYPACDAFADDELLLLEAVAAYAGVAIGNARLYEAASRRAARQQALADGAAALASPTSTTEVMDALVGAYTGLLGTRDCAIGLFDHTHERITMIASGASARRRDGMPFTAVPAPIVERLTSTWRDHPDRTVAFGGDPWFAEVTGGTVGAVRHLVLPLGSGGRVRGAVVLGLADDERLDDEERAAAHGLAALATATLERTLLVERLERHGRQMDALYAVSRGVVEGAGSDELAERLDALLTGQGIEVVGLAWREARVRNALGGPAVDAAETAAWDDDAAPDVLDGGVRSVPMRLEGRIVGGLRVRVRDVDADDEAFLAAVARGVAEVAHRSVLHSALERARRQRAVADERDRIAADLHDSVGQQLVAIGLVSRRSVEQLPHDSPWAERFARIAQLADSGKWDVDQAVRVLAHVPTADRDLAGALRDLADGLGGDSGIRVIVEAVGEPRLDAAVQRALYRVAHEALINAWRHARCSTVRVGLRVEGDGVELVVRDDGIGLDPRHGSTEPRTGIATMRRLLHEVGGTVRVRDAPGARGVLVTAHVPRRRDGREPS